MKNQPPGGYYSVSDNYGNGFVTEKPTSTYEFSVLIDRFIALDDQGTRIFSACLLASLLCTAYEKLPPSTQKEFVQVLEDRIGVFLANRTKHEF